MHCYLDSSVLIRQIFQEPHPLKEWKKIKFPFSSQLISLESFRTLDRWRLQQHPSSEEIAIRSSVLHHLIQHVGLLPITPTVLSRASQPLAIPLGSLDSIHLATALLWREKHGSDFSFATHDQQLGLAAQSLGLKVIGL